MENIYKLSKEQCGNLVLWVSLEDFSSNSGFDDYINSWAVETVKEIEVDSEWVPGGNAYQYTVFKLLDYYFMVTFTEIIDDPEEDSTPFVVEVFPKEVTKIEYTINQQ